MTSTIMANASRYAKQIRATTYAEFYSAISALNAGDLFCYSVEGAVTKTLTNNKVTTSTTGIGVRMSDTRLDLIFRDGSSTLYAERVDIYSSSVTISTLNRATMTSM